MKFFRKLAFFLTPYAAQKRLIAARLRAPATAALDDLLRRIWTWKGYRHELVADDGWQGEGAEEWHTLIVKPSEGEWFHLRYAPARKAAWAMIRTPSVVIELPGWTDDAWLVERFFKLELMLDQLPEHPAIIGLFA